MKERLENLLKNAKLDVDQTSEEVDMNLVKSKYMGKNSEFTSIMKEMGSLSSEEKKSIGLLTNEFRTSFTEYFENKLNKIKAEALNKRLESERIDISLPGKGVKTGSLHPLTHIRTTLEDLFVSMGYDVVEGPQVETDDNCFEKLNIPKEY